MAAPGNADWNLDFDDPALLATLSASFPDGVTEWQVRWRLLPGTGWTLLGSTAAGSVTLSEDADSGNYEAQARWSAGSHGGLPSEWSATKFITA
jgi:hypothetical protein